MMNFEGNTGVEEKPLYTGLALCKPNNYQTTENHYGFHLDFKMVNSWLV